VSKKHVGQIKKMRPTSLYTVTTPWDLLPIAPILVRPPQIRFVAAGDNDSFF